MNELTGDRDQIVQCETKATAQHQHQGLLLAIERGLKTVCRVRSILNAVAMLPAPNGVFGHTEFLGKHAYGFVRGLDICTTRWGGGGVLV